MMTKATKKHYLQILALWAAIAALMVFVFPFEALEPSMLKYNKVIISFMACSPLIVALSAQAVFCIISALICVLMARALVWDIAEKKRSFILWWMALATLLFLLSVAGVFIARNHFSNSCA
jgi:hypothetical protein